jgi:hypothetical protein
VLQPLEAGYGSTTLGWSRDGGIVTFTYDRGDHAAWDPFPAEVHQTALFTTAGFSRR